jgi:lipoprotein-anchoring transpeptidase ErfK/SrfK
MPERRPPPVRLPSSRSKKAPSAKSKPPRKRKSGGDDSNLSSWIAGGLLLLLGLFVAAYYETDQLRAWLTPAVPEDQLPQKSAAELAEKPVLPVAPAPSVPAPIVPAPAVPSPTPKPPVVVKPPQTLKEKADAQTALLVQQSLAKQPLPTSPNLPPVGGTPPPLVRPPAPVLPARALPVETGKLSTEQIAAYQVALERIHFSCGFIDGDQGMRTQRMLRAYQESHGLPVTGFLDAPTRDSIGEPGEPFLSYVVTREDVGSIMPKPATWREKSKVPRLGYNEIWEMLAEKFHCTRAYLKALNRGVTTPVAGTEIIGPKVYPAAHIPPAASLRILLSETSIEALDSSGKIIAFFPCSIAKDKNKRPHGLLTVKVVDPNPDYTFDPALFADAARAEGLTHKMTLPPGPRNPVGTTWVGLSLPGYGIHGTPEPENISRTQSHGCFRLANWNAEKVLKMVRVGTPVDVQP